MTGSIFLKPCSWAGCKKPASFLLDVTICEAHARIAHRAWQEILDLQTSAHAEVQATLKQTAEKINAGVRLTKGDLVPGWVYYIQIDDTIKIGYAKNVATRMRSYAPTARLLAVEPGTKTLEHTRHDHFHAYLAHGREWFRDVTELRDWIDTLINEYGNPHRMAYHYTTPNTQVVGSRNNRGVKKTAA